MASANEGLRAEVVEHQRVKGRLLALMLDAIAKERVGARSGPDLRVFALQYCRSASSVITTFVLQMISKKDTYAPFLFEVRVHEFTFIISINLCFSNKFLEFCDYSLKLSRSRQGTRSTARS